VAACKSVIQDLFNQGKSYKNIALVIGSNPSAVALRVQRYRKQEPDKWQRLKNYVEPLNLKMEVYHCSDCVVVFAVEATDDLHDVTCPYYWQQDKLVENGFSYLKVKELV
jgi:hypothetical protein